MELELGSFSAVEVIMNPTLPQLQENSGPRQVVFKPSAEIITAYLLQSDNILNICLTMFRMDKLRDLPTQRRREHSIAGLLSTM